MGQLNRANSFAQDQLRPETSRDSSHGRLVSKECSESALIEGMLRGEDAAFSLLVKSHIAPMLLVARRFLAEEDARDAVQDAFVKAFQSISKFRADAKLTTWLHRIVINTCISKTRQNDSRKETSTELLAPEFLEDGHQSNPTQPWPDQVVEQKQLKTVVDLGIRQLPVDYRTIIVLRDIEGYSVAETAAFLGIKPSLVKVRLHRARQSLRELLDPYVQRDQYDD